MPEISMSDFLSKEKSRISDAQESHENKINDLLKKVVGEDYKLIKSIAFDDKLQKFYDIKAPDYVIEKLRKAGLAKD